LGVKNKLIPRIKKELEMDTNESKRKRKTWSADEKIGVIRKHLSKSKMVDTCEENKVSPVVFSQWLKTVLEAGRDALLGTSKKETRERDRLIEKYEKELQRKNAVIAELSSEVLDLKKKSGEN